MNLHKLLKSNSSRKVDVSVVIPTFNRMQYLYPALFCLLNQKVKNVTYEIVIVDSGTDETGPLIKKMQTMSVSGRLVYKRIKKNKNRSLLRNIGADMASGELLVFLDNDMLVPSTFIKTHYMRHQDRENLVLLGKRKSLTEFNPEKAGYDSLINHFDILDEMPYYRDVRDAMLDDIGLSIKTVPEPWRFLFSHNFSISKKYFKKIGGFSKEFGEHWGYEDIELGFRCYLHDACFEMEETLSVYHQTHFEQSRTEQSFALYNRNLFTQKHQCFETELYAVLYHYFEDFYPVLMKIREDVFQKINLSRHTNSDVVFGCLFTSKSIAPSKKFFLGVDAAAYDDNTLKKVLVLETFWLFPYEVQLLIMKEALRIAEDVAICNTAKFNEESLRSLCQVAGFTVSILKEEERVVIQRKLKTKPLMYVITVPDIYSPVRRLCYLLLVKSMYEAGLDIHVADLKETKDCENEDFLLPVEDRAKLNPLFGKGYGGYNQNVIHSESILYLADLNIPNDKRFIIIHDMEYLSRSEQALFSEKSHCQHISRNFLEKQLISSLFDYIQTYSDNLRDIQEADDVWCCFMESGYLEDGVDIILEAFSRFHAKNSNSCLKIKIPDFRSLYTKNSPLNNDSSKYGKSYGMLFKLESDLRLLTGKIEELHLQDSALIIRENMSLYRVLELIQSCIGVVCASRGVLLSADVYMALLMKKRVLVPERCYLDERFNTYVYRVGSHLKSFAKEFCVPVNSGNLAFLASSVEAGELSEKWMLTNNQMLSWECFNERVLEIINEYDNEIYNYFGEIHRNHGSV